MTRPPGTRLRTAAGTYPARGETRALHVDVWSLCLVCLFVCLPSVCLLAPEGGEQPTRTGQVASGMGSDAPSHGVYALCACVSVCLLDCWGETASPPPARPGMSCSRSFAHSLTRSLSLSPAIGKRFCMFARTPARTRHAARDMPGPCRGKHRWEVPPPRGGAVTAPGASVSMFAAPCVRASAPLLFLTRGAVAPRPPASSKGSPPERPRAGGVREKEREGSAAAARCRSGRCLAPRWRRTGLLAWKSTKPG